VNGSRVSNITVSGIVREILLRALNERCAPAFAAQAVCELSSLPSAFVRKLSAFTRLSDEDKQLLLRVVNERSRKVAAGCNVSNEGDVTRAITIIEAGWAVQYRSLDDGRRQILTLMLPGDIFDLNILLLDRMDYSVVTKTGAQISEISVEGFDALMGGHPRVRQALWWEQLVQHSIQKEWTINLGQRTAYERMAHLFCEVFTRLRIVGLTDSTSCDFPLTQNDLGEIAGLSPVHVNRTLQALRADGLVELERRTLSIPDFPALAEAGLFDPAYLHLGGVGQHLGAN
jgi:CRP-like cAMP-binding protein